MTQTHSRLVRVAFCSSLLAGALLLGLLLGAPVAHAHPPGFGLLDLAERAPGRWEAQLRVSGAPARALALVPRWPDGCEAGEPRVAVVSTGVDRRWSLRCPPGPLRGELGVGGAEGEAPLDDLQLVLRLRPRDRAGRTASLDAQAPTLALGGPGGVFPRYLRLGTEHVLGGPDHLLFVLGLLLLLRGRFRPVALTLTAFTLGHSVTLGLAALGVIPVAGAGAEAVIALSLLLLAVELTREGPPTLTRRRPGLVAAGFGLVHGLGFAGALREAGLPEDAVPTALLAFNLGVELGQLLFVAAALLLAALAARVLPRLAPLAERGAITLLGTAGAYWFFFRLAELG
ncbi:MAG: HupE/UreJ family protein [Myxococcota bacterium]